MALGFYSPFLHDFADKVPITFSILRVERYTRLKDEYNVLHEVSKKW